MDGIGALVRKRSELVLFPPGWDMVKSQRSAHQVGTLAGPRWQTDLEFPGSRTVNNICLLFTRHLAHGLRETAFMGSGEKAPEVLSNAHAVRGLTTVDVKHVHLAGQCLSGSPLSGSPPSGCASPCFCPVLGGRKPRGAANHA